MKICLVCASGGHLIEMLRLNDAFDQYDSFLVTYKGEFLNIPKNVKNVYYIRNILVNRVQARRIKKSFLLILQTLISAVKQIEILLVENPDVIISTGSEIAIPIFYISKILGKRIIFIESLCRIDDLSGTGKIVKPISDIFLVQWSILAKKYKNVKYKGNILENFKTIYNKSNGSFIFATVGTAPFPRLVKKMDEISRILNERIIMQIGKTDYKPRNMEYFDFADYDTIKELNRNAKIVISHAGIGSIITALEAGTPLIVVPRLRKYGELIDDHQLEIARVLKEQKLADVSYDIGDIPYIIYSFNCTRPSPSDNQNLEKQNDMVKFIKKILTSNFEIR